jgi:thiamine pyrophosphokinase
MSDGRSVLVAGAPLEWTPRLTELARAGNPLLAADGGANHLARIGVRPRAAIGDFDSIEPETRAWVGEEALIHTPDQDRTDLDKALSHAFAELGLDRLTVIAALGGRADHDVGNLGLLARLAMNDRLRFEGPGYRVVAVRGGLSLPARPGETWSFWTYDPAVSVSLEGVRWPVRDAPLDAAGRPSISNVAVEERIRVEAENGPVVAMRYLGDKPR